MLSKEVVQEKMSLVAQGDGDAAVALAMNSMVRGEGRQSFCRWLYIGESLGSHEAAAWSVSSDKRWHVEMDREMVSVPDYEW